MGNSVFSVWNTSLKFHFNEERTTSIIASGECGDVDSVVTWTFDTNGLLKIDGKGAMGSVSKPAKSLEVLLNHLLPLKIFLFFHSSLLIDVGILIFFEVQISQ